MTDVHTIKQRKFNMSRIRSKNTKPERFMFSLLKDAGYKFRRHYPVAGKPDIAFPRLKLAVFIDGEFWHGKKFSSWKERIPSFWKKKIGDNIKRDTKERKKLREKGWSVIRYWGRDIVRNPEKQLRNLTEKIRKITELSK